MFAPLEQQGLFRRPIVPSDCQHNGHMYYILLEPEIDRQQVLDELKRNKIGAVFHYVPLHSSPAGMRFGRCSRRSFVDDVVIAAADQAADVVWSERSPATAGRRCIKRFPATLDIPALNWQSSI